VAYLLIPGEPVPAGIRRIVREEMEAAARQLSGEAGSDRDEAIHEARKSMKKIRGVLRLMRPEMGAVYQRENNWYRNVGGRLSEFRDAGAMIETFDALIEEHREELGRRKLGSIRRGLMARKQNAEVQAGMAEVFGTIAGGLRRRVAKVEAWPLVADGFPALAMGLEATFRGGRKARARVRKHPTPANYHEWRKRVKDHWYHVRLLEKYWSGAMESYEKSLKELENWLGEDHNLVVLQETVVATPALFGKELEIALFQKLIDQYHEKLRGYAVSMGKHIYGEKPRPFIKRLRRLWEDGQAA
jgi:CHAD domain-containing protein